MYLTVVRDIKTDENGDILLSDNNDIIISQHEDAIYQMIATILSTPPEDAEILPLTSFDPNAFLGHIIDDDLLRNLKNTILDTLTENSSLYRSELEVQVFKMTEESVAITIKLLTIENHYAVRATFDTTTGSIASFIYRPNYKINTDDVHLIEVPFPETKLTENP